MAQPPILPRFPIVRAGPAPAPGNNGDFFTTYIDDNVLVPLVKAFWQVTYILPDNLQQGVVAPDNPILGSLANAPVIFRIG